MPMEHASFMRESNISRITNLVDSDGAVARQYGVSGVPKMVFVSADGKVQRAVTGGQGVGTLRAWLESATQL